MEEKDHFLRYLRRLRRKLRIGQLIHDLQSLLLAVSVLSLMVTGAVWIKPFPYWKAWLGAASIFLILLMAIRLYRKRASYDDSVKVYDEVVGENLVTTTYEGLDGNHPLFPLILKDSLKSMKTHAQYIQGRRHWKLRVKVMVSTLFLLGGTVLMMNQGSHAFKTAAKIEKRMEVTKESNERLEKLVKKEPQLKEVFAKELRAIKTEKNPEKRQKAIAEKIREIDLKTRRIEERKAKRNRLENIAKQVGADRLAEALQKKDKLAVKKELEALSQSQLAKLEKRLGTDSETALMDALKSPGEGQGEALAKLNEHLEREATALGAANEGSAGKPEAASPPSKSEAETEPGSDPSSQSPRSTSPSGEAGSGTGKGTGSGGGTGSGNGSGRGSGSFGIGAGMGQGSREFLTIPDRMEGDTTMELDKGKLNKGKQGEQFSSDGPVERGSVRSYEDVYQEYYSSYRKAEDRQTIPQDLESVVESYFSEIDPGE